MMKRILGILILNFPFFIYAQSNNSQSIHWIRGLRWHKIEEQAKRENKYIFVDCYATWCGPCKEMDRNVYTDDSVIDHLNEKFISIRLQMDKTKNDDSDIIVQYADAESISTLYTVTSYPTFLFFSPEGLPIHKATGYKSPDQFVALINDALNPNKQYYSILKDFRPGKLDTSELIGLARSFRFSDKDLAEKIAVDYLARIPRQELGKPDNIKLMTEFKESKEIVQVATKYLNDIPKDPFSRRRLFNIEDKKLLIAFKNIPALKLVAMEYIRKLPQEKLYTLANLEIMAAFIQSSKDPWFRFFLENGKKIDEVVRKENLGRNYFVTNTYAEAIVDEVIHKELIYPCFDIADSLNRDVDWRTVFAVIKKKTCAALAIRNIINAKVNWYKYKTQKAEKQKVDATKWGEKFAIAFANKLEKYGVDTSGNGFMAAMTGNDLESSIYRYCNDQYIISKAIKWLQTVMISIPGFYYSYVYAGLLYKLSRLKDAISWQEMTIQVYLGDCFMQKKDPNSDNFYEEQVNVLQKMKKHAPVKDIIQFL
ncbi:MAG: DUF255 domain-containing protein [Chitinophagaceae bacterium]